MNLTKCIASTPEYNKLTGQSSPSGWFIQFPFDAEFLEQFKEFIDRAYREWNPATKTWWVDEECWLPLSELFENWNQPIVKKKKDKHKVKSCHLCGGTGLLPFVKKDGKVSSSAKVFCECNPQINGYSSPYPYQYTPEMFDFPMSYDFRSFIEQEITGKPLPILTEKETSVSNVEVYRHHPHIHQYTKKVSGKLLIKVESLDGKIKYLENKLNGTISKRKRKPSY